MKVKALVSIMRSGVVMPAGEVFDLPDAEVDIEVAAGLVEVVALPKGPVDMGADLPTGRKAKG